MSSHHKSRSWVILIDDPLKIFEFLARESHLKAKESATSNIQIEQILPISIGDRERERPEKKFTFHFIQIQFIHKISPIIPPIKCLSTNKTNNNVIMRARFNKQN